MLTWDLKPQAGSVTTWLSGCQLWFYKWFPYYYLKFSSQFLTSKDQRTYHGLEISQDNFGQNRYRLFTFFETDMRNGTATFYAHCYLFYVFWNKFQNALSRYVCTSTTPFYREKGLVPPIIYDYNQSYGKDELVS